MTHYLFNNALIGGSRLRNGLNALEVGRDLLTKELATMVADLTGPSSDPASFGNVVTRYGFQNTTEAKAAFDEMNTDMGRINSDAATSNVKSGLDQMFNFLR